MRITYAWRRTADERRLLVLDVLVEDEAGWRMMSFAGYQAMADMAMVLDR